MYTRSNSSGGRNSSRSPVTTVTLPRPRRADLAARILGQLGIGLDADHLAVRRRLGQRREGAQRPAAGIQAAGRRGRARERDQRLGLAPPDLGFERQPVDLGLVLSSLVGPAPRAQPDRQRAGVPQRDQHAGGEPAATAAGLVPNTRLVTSPTEPVIAAARNTVPTMVRPLEMCTSRRLAPRRQTIRWKLVGAIRQADAQAVATNVA